MRTDRPRNQLAARGITPHVTDAQSQPAHSLQCLEVWGGNTTVDNGVVMPGLDAWLVGRPHDGAEGGGDVHYLSSCATGRITRLLVADVSGHGAKVADLAVTLRGLMRRFINFIDQARFVSALNREFAALSRDGIFATAVAGTYWAPTRTLTLCNAGHPRPLWYRAKLRRWQTLAIDPASDDGPANIPLGIVDDTRYEQLGVRLSPGDLVLVYTDSLTDARDAAGRTLGEQGLVDLTNGLDVSDPRAFIDALLAQFEQRGVRIDDDVTVMLLRPNGVAVATSLLERATGFVRFLRSLLPSRDGRSELPGYSRPLVGGLLDPALNLSHAPVPSSTPGSSEPGMRAAERR